MYLKYIQIVNYKNLKNAKFEFSKGTNTIIGENDSGKSNALTAMRILLDSDYYYNANRLKESDFSHSLGEWRGHWIIISAMFDDISNDDRESEICNEISVEQEDSEFLKSFIRCKENSYGTVTLFIRPMKNIRKKLHDSTSNDEFEKIRSGIKLSDYEFVYKARSQADFTKNEVYDDIVGDIDQHQYSDPDNEDSLKLGVGINILDLWQYISISFIDALRDAESEMKKPRNPIRRIFDALQDEIADEDITSIQNKVKDLNDSLANIKQISNMGASINAKLQDIVGLIYSPEVTVQSRLREDIGSIARYLSVVPSGEDSIDLLGLGHLNILYIALKLVEFEANRSHEILNIMMVEEPEAHIHTHIQRTLFDNLGLANKYTQIIMTTHSTHISEVADIESMNVLKADDKSSIVMRPTHGLDEFGEEKLHLKDLQLSSCLRRYLDSKRSVLLFSKGVVLVEGDAEEILIPVLAKKVLGMSLDEMGIGLINVGSVSFEYVASVFSEERLQRKCAIITDSDSSVTGADKSNQRAASIGASRKAKLDDLFKNNQWVNAFFAPHTFEVDFAKAGDNCKYYKELVNKHYKDRKTINNYLNNLDGNEGEMYDAVINMVNQIGKGWAATIISQIIDKTAVIPDYIIEALAFASSEVISTAEKRKMMHYVIGDNNSNNSFIESIIPEDDNTCEQLEDKYKKQFPDSSLTRFFNYQQIYGKRRL